MANIIDLTYFRGEINIPGFQSEAQKNIVNGFISKYEPEYLQYAMGYPLWSAFVAGLEADVVAEKWLSLRDGIVFTNKEGRTKKWEGFKNSERKSPISMYVYYWFSRNANTVTTVAGEAKEQSENAINVSGALKQSRVYNEMVSITRLLWEYLDSATDGDGNALYTEWNKLEANEEMFFKINIYNL